MQSLRLPSQPVSETETETERDNGEPKARITTAIREAFERFWKAYPSRSPASSPKKPALQRFAKLVAEGCDAEQLVKQAGAYAEYCRITQRLPRFILMASSFLGVKEAWRNDYTPNWKWASEVDDPIIREMVWTELGKILNREAE